MKKLIQDLKEISVHMRGRGDNIAANRIDQAIELLNILEASIKWEGFHEEV